MNNSQDAFLRLLEILNRLNSGCILLPKNPSIDALAAATALYLALMKLGKNATLVCSSDIEEVSLTGTDKIQKNINVAGDSLVISFPYKDGAVDKVDYNITGDKFNLIITPRPNHQKINPSQVQYSYTGGKVDFFIVIDAADLNNLEELYTDNKNQFVGVEIVNIDRHLTNSNFGTINIVNKTASSISEIIFSLMQSLKIEIDKTIATNLYAGIVSATNNFSSYSVNADTLENAAKLLRLGAIKKILKPTPPKIFKSPLPPNQIISSNKFSPEIQTKPIDIVEKENETEKQLPQDWLKPKIFRGGGLI